MTIPKEYQSLLNLRDTEVAIKKLKDYFERALSYELLLTRVSAPLFVRPETGLNDNLNGVEHAVRFQVKDAACGAEVVHSLAKWKRQALARYGFGVGEGLYTDMNAIRREEELDNLHSIYVDQWDWEQVLHPEERTLQKLKQIVRRIYNVFKNTERFIGYEYRQLQPILPDEITFVATDELEQRFPHLSPRERENAITREKKAVFLMQIGKPLSDGSPHDGRAPDYDDWERNGDILFWSPVLQRSFELSSMGIRVDAPTLLRQLEQAGCPERSLLPFHRQLLEGELPTTIGGGIGQSRICMYFLQKAHIGEVQASIWPEEMVQACARNGIELL
ncbi:MAG TPA: aspartate--ammonia ligase [Thermotogota bacterium]|nr:aspartate--ammonia ligase [Thermotogota bacterium]HRW92394.1 aspartate--ammonia ligase [Thermotogota bacterium]